jgi:hypothetical protein
VDCTIEGSQFKSRKHQEFPLLRMVQTGSKRYKAASNEADQSHVPITMSRKHGCIHPLSCTSSCHGYLLINPRDNFTVYLNLRMNNVYSFPILHRKFQAFESAEPQRTMGEEPRRYEDSLRLTVKIAKVTAERIQAT